MSRLLNGDIRIHAESLEANKTLLEKTDWTRMVAASAAVHTRTFTVRANGSGWKISKLPINQ